MVKWTPLIKGMSDKSDAASEDRGCSMLQSASLAQSISRTPVEKPNTNIDVLVHFILLMGTPICLGARHLLNSKGIGRQAS